MSPSSSCLWVFVCGSAGAFALGVLLLWSGSDSGSGAAELLSTTFLSTSLSNTAAAVHTWLDHSIYQHQHQRQHQHQHRHQGSESSSRCDLDVNAGLDAERSHHMVQEMWPLESTGIMEELNKSKESDLQEQHHDQEQQSRNATASSRAWAWLNALASRGNSKPINNIETSHSSDDAHGHGHAHHGHNHVHGHAPNAGSASVPGSEPESEFHSGFHHDGHTHIDIDVGSVSWFDAGSRSRLGSGGESSAFSALEPELSLSSLPYEGDVEFHAHDHDEHELWPTMFHILDQIDEQEQRFMALQATGGAQPTEAPGQQSTVSSAGPTAPPLSPLPVPLVSCVRSVVQEWDDHVECVVTLDRVPVSRNTYVTLTSDPTQGLFSPNVVVYVPGQGNTTINGTGNTSHSNNTTPLTLATVNATSTPTSTSSSSQSNQLSNTITLGFTEDNYATPQIITVYGLTQYSETPSSSSWCMSSLVSTDTGHSRSVDCIANSSLITSHYAFPSITSISPTIVPLTGANVTLTGTNLDHVVVFMGNILVGISQQNDTHVIFRAPPSPTQANATWNNMYQSITVAVPDQTGKGAIPFDFFHSYIEPMNNDTDTGTPTPQIPSWPTNATLGGCLFCPGVPPESETVNGLTPETSSRYELLRSANNVARQSASLPCPFVLAGASGNSGQSRCAPAAQTLYYLKTSCAEGEYSTPDGDTCLPCPSDRAICPGGPRMWPKPGYWTYSESALQVQECLPPSLDRCPVGGRLSPCGGAYNQPICSYCQPNFYWDTGSCRPCDAFNSVEAALVVTVTSLFFIILGTFVTYLSDTHLEWMVVAVVSGQQVIQVGRSVSQYMSPTFALVYNFMKIFCFDYQFVRPGCVEHEVKFVNLYWGALVYLVFVYAFFMVCALVYQWRHGAPGENWIKNPSQPRMVRAIISAYHIVYMQMVMYTLQIINCVRDDLSPDLVLVAETSQVCFDHLHKPVYIVALIVLLLYCIGVPLFFVGVLAKFRSQHSTRRFQRKWGFLFSEFHPTFYWWSLCDYTGSFFMALQLTLIRFNALLIITTSTSLFVFDVIITAAFRPFHVRYKNHAAFVIGTGKIFSCAILFFLRGNVAPGVIVLVACVALVVLSFFLVRRIRGKDKAKNLANANTQQLLTMRMGKDGDQHRDEMHGFGAGKLPNSNYVYGQGKSGLGLSLGGGLNPLPIAAVNLNEMDVRCIHDLSADMPLDFDYAAYQDANIRFTYSNQEDQPGDGPHLSDLANHSTRAGPKADHAIEHDELSTFEQPPLNAWTEQASQQAGQQHHRRSHSHSRRHSHSGSHRHIRSHSHSRATNRPRTASVQVHADALRRMSGPAAVRLDPIPKSERPRSHSHGKPESQSDSRSRSRSLSLQPHSGYLSHDQRAAAPVPAFSRHSISSSEPESFQLERAAIAEAAYQDQSRLARYGSPVTLIHSAESADPSPPPAGASAPVRVRALTFSLSSLEQAILQDVDSYRYIPGDEGVVCIPGDATHDDASASASVYT